LEFQPKCHTKSPKYRSILFSNHQFAVFNNQNHLFNHHKYIFFYYTSKKQMFVCQQQWKTTVCVGWTVILRVGKISSHSTRLNFKMIWFKINKKHESLLIVLSSWKNQLVWVTKYNQANQDNEVIDNEIGRWTFLLIWWFCILFGDE